MSADQSPLLDQSLSVVDPEIAAVLDSELARQQSTLEMIASENFVPRAVLQAQGSVLTNKYAEGYPGKRYYGGCEQVDVAETLAITRAKALFGADHANVQPHSGATANAAVLHALINAGDKILGLELAHGGHLTHGMKLNFSGKLYEVGAYGVDPETFLVDMDKVREAALVQRPDVIIGGWSAYPRQLDFAAFRSIADEVGAKLWVDMAHFAASSSAARSSPRRSTLRCSRASRAARSCTSSPRRPCRSRSPQPRSSVSGRSARSPVRGSSPSASWRPTSPPRACPS
jgi:glycine hydroxymethyltransferase